MLREIKRLRNGTVFSYGMGSYDDWCVYETTEEVRAKRVGDYDYFKKIRELGEIYGRAEVFEDFCDIYEATRTEVDNKVLSDISRSCEKYHDDYDKAEYAFCLLYLSMVAEMNKEYSRLGKRIKGLGIHQLLFQKMKIHDIANFTRGKKWFEVAAACEQHGF